MTAESFTNQTMVVTGAVGGISGPIAWACVTAGGRVVLADIDDMAGSALAGAPGGGAVTGAYLAVVGGKLPGASPAGDHNTFRSTEE
jgi:NAD(P)-dependent dehydrogenase (short-subunit alcohol dehydrogenase family)